MDNIMHPTVSVLIPTYNRSGLLKKALESVLSQKFVDYEVIIIDNCSTDNTEAVINGFEDVRIKYHRNDSNIGPIHNHNRALRLATGKYICIFSDDDIMLPDNLSLKVRVLDDYHTVGLVHSGIKGIDKEGKVFSEEHWNAASNASKILKSNELMTSTEAYKFLYDEWNFIAMPSVLIRKSILDENRLEFNNQLQYLIDWDLWIKLSEYVDFFYIKEPLVLYRSHETNESALLNESIYIKELYLIKLSLLKIDIIDTDFSLKIKEIHQSIIKQLAIYNKLFGFKSSDKQAAKYSFVEYLRRKAGGLF